MYWVLLCSASRHRYNSEPGDGPVDVGLADDSANLSTSKVCLCSLLIKYVRLLLTCDAASTDLYQCLNIVIF